MKALLKIMKSSCPHKNEETQNVITLDIIRCAKKIEEKKMLQICLCVLPEINDHIH